MRDSFTHMLMTTTSWRALLTKEDGQDIVEYTLLASFVGFAMAAAVTLLGTAMNQVYSSWDKAAQSDALVEVPDPK